MRQRNHKFIFLTCLAVSWAVMGSLYLQGCSDNPEAKAAKEMRDRTAQAVQMSVTQKDFDKALELLEKKPSRGLTRDTAVLAGGNLALAKGRQLQEDLDLKTLPLRGAMDKLEKVLRDSEALLIEKERIETLLMSGETEVAELRLLLDGDSQQQGLNEQLQQVNAQMEELLSQKEDLLQKQNQVQADLDDYQNNADALMRQAELAQGDRRLELEQQAFSLLQERKDHYIQAQALENSIAVLDKDIELIQVRLDGLSQSIEDIKQRIDQVVTSSIRTTLQDQIAEIEKTIDTYQRNLDALCNEISSGLNAYRQDTDKICTEYEEAMTEFQQVQSPDLKLTATLRLANSAYFAAHASSSCIKVHTYTAQRSLDLLDSSDPVFVSAIKNKLPTQNRLGADYNNKALAFFDQSIEAYETAFSKISSLSRNLKPEDQSKIQEAQCSILKSQVLALHSKMQLADLLEEFDLANSTETAMNDVIQKGTEMGACFTQSEAMRVIVNEGLDYLPSLPLNMEVFLEGKKQELSTWKSLPVSQQESVVDENIRQIDELIAEYGQDAAVQLEPLKQEMVSAKERGFTETAPSTTSPFGDPNSF